MINPNPKVEAFKSPFRHWIIRNFLQDPGKVREEFRKLPFNRKECDLFQFFQGEDLGKTDNEVLREFYEQFSSSNFISKISQLTGMQLSHIDMSPFIYEDTDHLLPHDDRLEGRRIAYALYLNTVPKGKGGTLDLLKDNLVHKSLIPEEGTIVLFEVTERSLHQVAEVMDAERLSFAGWFHG